MIRRPLPLLLPLALLLGGCLDRELPTAVPADAAALAQVESGPVVNSLADPGDGTCDETECTLREAIAFASAGATITLDPSLIASGPAAITLAPDSGQLTIEKDLTITGPGADRLSVRRDLGDSEPYFRILAVERYTTVSISGLTFTGGRAHHWPGLVNSGTLTLSGVQVSDNSVVEAGNVGGGISNFGTLTLSQSIVSNNRNIVSNGYGGGIYNDGTMTIAYSTITGNRASSIGGGVYNSTGTIIISHSTISGNSAQQAGGILVNGTHSMPSIIINSTISGNTAGTRGGGVLHDGPTRILNSTITGNRANSGGGIWTWDDIFAGEIVVRGSIVAGNTTNAGIPNDVAANEVNKYGFRSTGYNLIGAAGENVTLSTDFAATGDQTGVSDAGLGPLADNGGPTWTHALLPGSPAIDRGACTDDQDQPVATDQRDVTRPQGGGCDTGAYEKPADETPPVLTPSVSGTLGSNGWYTSDVTVTWQVVDEESEITSQTGCGPTTISTDTDGTTLTCTASSAGGTATESVTLKHDATAPSLSPSVSPNPVLLNGSASASPNASDAMSGVATASCGVVNTSTVGAKAVTCTATDYAGNTASAQAGYTVTYDFRGFTAPVQNPPVLNIAKAGQTIPLKWRVLNANGDPITTLGSVTVTAVHLACDLGAPTGPVGGSAPGASGLQNLGNGYYQFNWQTAKSFAGSCKTMYLDLGEGITRTALFQFTR